MNMLQVVTHESNGCVKETSFVFVRHLLAEIGNILASVQNLPIDGT
jgi:hypothetical protein